MKKPILVFICLLIWGKLFAQDTFIRTFENWTNGYWLFQGRTIEYYDDNGYLTNSLSQMGYPGNWINSYQTTYTYNSMGGLQEQTTQKWDLTLNIWNYSSQITYTNDSSNLPLIIVYENLGFNPNRSLNTYDANGYLINTVRQNWDGTDWINSSQSNYTNSSNGTVLQYSEQIWSSNAWVNSYRRSDTYNSSNNLLTSIGEYWYSGIGNWINTEKVSYTYDTNEFLINKLRQTWSSGIWMNFEQYNYTNNNDGNIHQWISQNWDNGWQNAGRSTYEYSSISSSIEPGSFTLNIFPNPCTDKIKISLASNSEGSYSISDSRGKIYINGHFIGNEITIDVDYLPSNVYIIILEQDNKKRINRFIKN